MPERLLRTPDNEYMHIAHVTSFSSAPALLPSSEVRARGIAYRAAGHDFTVVVPGAIASVACAEFGTVVTVPSRSAGLKRGIAQIPFAICRALDRVLPDRLEVADRLSFRQLGMWARENHVPAILFADEISAEGASDRVFANFDRVVSGTDSSDPDPEPASADPSEACSASVPQILKVRPGVDLEIFSPLRHNSELRDTSGADLILVCPAPLTASGAVSLAIETTRELVALGTNVHLIILGNGPLRSRLERHSRGLPVQFLSAQTLSLTERSEVLATADIAIITLRDSAGHALALEAMASGTPVVMSGRSKHDVDFSGGGGVRSLPDVEHMADAISALGNEPVENRRRAARDIAVKFDAMPLARTMLALHESLL